MLPEYSFELIKIDDELKIKFDKPYSDVKVSISLWFEIALNASLDSDDVSIILGICKFDVLKEIGKAIEKKVDELK